MTSASSSWYQHLQPCQYQVADARLVAFVAFHFVLLGIFLFLFFIFAIPIILNTLNVMLVSVSVSTRNVPAVFSKHWKHLQLLSVKLLTTGGNHEALRLLTLLHQGAHNIDASCHQCHVRLPWIVEFQRPFK